VKNVQENSNIILGTKIRILKTMAMIAVKCGSEKGQFKKVEEDVLDGLHIILSVRDNKELSLKSQLWYPGLALSII